MTDEKDSIRNKVVTLESLQFPAPPAAALAGFETARPDEESPAMMRMERLEQVRVRLAQESAEVGADLLITVPDREVSLVQSALARDGPG